MAGLLIIAIGATGLYANWNPRGWVRRYPFPALLVMAKFGNVSVVAELQRRYLKSDLSPRQEQRLVETALDKQNSLPAGFELREWLDLLVQLKQGGSLSEEQIDQYWAQAFHDAELVPRRRYRVGEQLVVGLVVDFRMEVENARIANERARSELLEKIYDIPQVELAKCRHDINAYGPDFLTCSFPYRFVHAGKDDVLIRANLVMDGRFWEGGAKVSKKVEITAPIEVVPADHVDPLTVVDDPAIKLELESLLSVDHQSSADSMGGPWVLQTYVVARQSLPCSIAADVFAENGETAEYVGTAYGWKGTRLVVSDIAPLPHERFGGKDLSLILQFNPQVARQTVDIVAVFSGDLRLKPVRIRAINDR